MAEADTRRAGVIGTTSETGVWTRRRAGQVAADRGNRRPGGVVDTAAAIRDPMTILGSTRATMIQVRPPIRDEKTGISPKLIFYSNFLF